MDGYNTYCIECTKGKSKKWINDNRDQFEINRRRHWNTKLYKDYEKRNFTKKKAKGYFKLWRTNNKDKLKQYEMKRLENKKHDITNEELSLLYEYTESSCMYCGLHESDSLDIYKQRLHRDHAINDGSNKIDNCLLACLSCNSSKKKKNWYVWYTEENENYDEYRFQKIVAWLNGFEQ